MESAPPSLRTPVLQAIPLGVLLLLTVFTLWSLQSEITAQVERQLEADLRDRIEAWESRLVERLVQITELAAADDARPGALQKKLRQDHHWFDSLYTWSPATTSANGAVTPGAFTYPFAPMTEDWLGLNRVPCIVQGRLVRSQPMFDRQEAADAMRAFCRGEPPAVRIIALTDAVDLLLRGGLTEDAQAAILADDLLPWGMTLHEAMGQRIPPQRAVVLRLEQADILERMGEIDEANALRTVTGFEIAALDAPDAAELLTYLFPVTQALRRTGQDEFANRIASADQMARRRVDAFRHIRANLLNRPAQADAPPRWVYDQLADDPYLLFTRWTRDGSQGVALQVDQDLLLQAFQRDMRSLRRHLTIRNADGTRRLAGPAGEIAVEIPFSTTLTHLRVGLRQEAVDEPMARLSNQWTFPLVLALVMVAFGVLSIVKQRQAELRSHALLARQREFATRVTHELKTPLAGIKVMAENLELGHFDGEREREEMASAIQREADRLTERVNEILAVAKERTVREPVAFDPEEPLLAAVDLWGPRLERAGVHFEADLEPTDELFGDPDALRDAVSCLLDNALKYRDEERDDPSVWLTLTQEGPRIRIEVVDNGLGVPAPQRASVFERFVRVEGPNRGKAGGHGLGLAQVAEIARAHDGTVRCTDGVDGGARFTIELPARAV